jgi:hypothetical protein
MRTQKKSKIVTLRWGWDSFQINQDLKFIYLKKNHRRKMDSNSAYILTGCKTNRCSTKIFGRAGPDN